MQVQKADSASNSTVDRQLEDLAQQYADALSESKSEKFKNAYWSGIVAVQGWRSESCPRRSIELDFEILGEKLDGEDYSQGGEFEPLFDPKAFVESHGGVDLDTFKINKVSLRQLAVKATDVRISLLEKSEALAEFEPIP